MKALILSLIAVAPALASEVKLQPYFPSPFPGCRSPSRRSAS
jgi:hypothetical protein